VKRGEAMVRTSFLFVGKKIDYENEEEEEELNLV
jgi:hypothetical protein